MSFISLSELPVLQRTCGVSEFFQQLSDIRSYSYITMMRAVGIALFALVAMAVAHPSGSGESPAAQSTQGAAQPPQLVDIINTAQQNINNLGKQIQEQLQLPDQETVVNTIKTQSTDLVKNVQTYITQVSEEVSKFPLL